jgi:hypothetical protein
MLFLSCELKEPERGKGNPYISSILSFFGKAMKKLEIFMIHSLTDEMSHSAIYSQGIKKKHKEIIFS